METAPLQALQKRVLIAGTPTRVHAIGSILEGHATVDGATTLKEALAGMEGADLIACELRFDDSRMFDFLNAAKANPLVRSTPFVCYRDIDSAFGKSFLRSRKNACLALGVAQFVDLFELQQLQGLDGADTRFRELLLALLFPDVPIRSAGFH